MKFFSTAAALALLLAAPAFAADAPAKVPTPQQQRMKDCNTQATGKKGEERRAFMSTCLKGPKAQASAQPAAAQAGDAAPTPARKKSHRGSTGAR